MADSNPYTPPSATVEDERLRVGADQLIPDGRRCPAGNGWKWIADSWELFRRQPGMWIAVVLIYWVLWMMISFIPLVNLAVYVLGPVMSAGFISMAHMTYRGERFDPGELFAGFRRQTGSLIILALINLAVMIVAGLVVALIAIPLISFYKAGNVDPVLVPMMIIFAVVVGILLIAAVAFAFVFAPALVYLHDVPPLEAIRMSFFGGLKNWAPGLVCGLIFMGLVLLSMLPLGLGLLITVPMAIIMVYAAYRDIFVQADAA